MSRQQQLDRKGTKTKQNLFQHLHHEHERLKQQVRLDDQSRYPLSIPSFVGSDWYWKAWPRCWKIFLLLRMDLCTEVLSLFRLSTHTHPTCGQIFFLRRKGITNEECLNHSTRRKHAMKESAGRGQQESAGNSWLRMRDCRKWPTDQRDREIPCRTTRITN